jgi:hypothetical protein
LLTHNIFDVSLKPALAVHLAKESKWTASQASLYTILAARPPIGIANSRVIAEF